MEAAAAAAEPASPYSLPTASICAQVLQALGAGVRQEGRQGASGVGQRAGGVGPPWQARLQAVGAKGGGQGRGGQGEQGGSAGQRGGTGP